MKQVNFELLILDDERFFIVHGDKGGMINKQTANLLLTILNAEQEVKRTRNKQPFGMPDGQFRVLKAIVDYNEPITSGNLITLTGLTGGSVSANVFALKNDQMVETIKRGNTSGH